MKHFVRSLLVAGLLGFALAGSAQETPPPLPPAPAAAPDTPAVTDPQPALRRLDAEAAPAETPAPAADPASAARRHSRNDRLAILGHSLVESDEVIHGDAVAVMGNLVVDGEVTRDAVAVLGQTTINGHIHGDVVAVMGNLRLGPNARVEGKIVCIGGRVDRARGSIVGGGIVQQSLGQNFTLGRPLESWWDRALSVGRPLAIGKELLWLWFITAFALGFYVLLALLFPAGLRRTGDLLIERPLAVILSALFTCVLLPPLFVLLLVTVIGIPVALLILPAGVILSTLFGKAAIYSLVGRHVANDRLSPASSVLVGGLIFVLLYLVPVVGLLLTLLVSLLGFGCSFVALSSSRKKSLPPPPATTPENPSAAHRGFFADPSPAVSEPPPARPFNDPATPPNPPIFQAPLGVIAPMVTPATESSSRPGPAPGWKRFQNPAPASVSPAFTPSASSFAPAVPNATLPRAGFWLRTGALLIDVLPIFFLLVPPGAGVLFFPCVAAYAAWMWKWRGTTLGGIVCGLRVVRLDDRPIDWPTAIARSLGCFLSLFVAGLGFFWVLFDEERQSWHDKIAGTVVVLAPKGTSLV